MDKRRQEIDYDQEAANETKRPKLNHTSAYVLKEDKTKSFITQQLQRQPQQHDQYDPHQTHASLPLHGSGTTTTTTTALPANHFSISRNKNNNNSPYNSVPLIDFSALALDNSGNGNRTSWNHLSLQDGMGPAGLERSPPPPPPPTTDSILAYLLLTATHQQSTQQQLDAIRDRLLLDAWLEEQLQLQLARRQELIARICQQQQKQHHHQQQQQHSRCNLSSVCNNLSPMLFSQRTSSFRPIASHLIDNNNNNDDDGGVGVVQQNQNQATNAELPFSLLVTASNVVNRDEEENNSVPVENELTAKQVVATAATGDINRASTTTESGTFQNATIPSDRGADVAPEQQTEQCDGDLVQEEDTHSVSSQGETKTVPLSLPSDSQFLSEYQSYVRKQVCFFQATEEDMKRGSQGRNKPIALRQVGVLCKHCAPLRPFQRPPAAVYFPGRLTGIYQSVQNLVTNHLLETCQAIPTETRERIRELKETKGKTWGRGRQHWVEAAEAVGVVEREHRLEFQCNDN